MTFDEWFEDEWNTQERSSRGLSLYFAAKRFSKAAWDAATEEVKKDHYRIGEEVERQNAWTHWEKAKIVPCSAEECSLCDGRVRRIPAWEPKDGEAVLAMSKSRKAFYAVSAGGIDIYDNSGMAVSGILEAYDIKPWKPDCQGKPWEEV